MLRKPRWVKGPVLACHGVNVGFRANRAELLRPIDPTFIPGSHLSASNNPDIVYSLEVDTARGVYTVSCRSRRLTEAREFDSVIQSLEAETHRTVAARAADRLFIHSGAVAWRGKAILLPGSSGAGKSTLVRELIRLGAVYLSDEFAVVDAEGLAYPFARPLFLRTASGKAHCAPGALGARTATGPVPIGMVVFTDYIPHEAFRPSPLSPGQALLKILQHVVAVRAHPAQALRIAKSVVSKCPVLQSARGDAGTAASAALRAAEQSWCQSD